LVKPAGREFHDPCPLFPKATTLACVRGLKKAYADPVELTAATSVGGANLHANAPVLHRIEHGHVDPWKFKTRPTQVDPGFRSSHFWENVNTLYTVAGMNVLPPQYGTCLLT